MGLAWRARQAPHDGSDRRSRDDAIGNVVVMLAALGVFGTVSACPALLVAAIMATLALVAAGSVVKQSMRELQGNAKIIR